MTRKQWLIAVILLFVTIIAWVVFDIFHSYSKVEIPQKVQDVIEPINPDFNTRSLED